MTVSHKKDPIIKDVIGVILVGGKSSRFGSNKALAKMDGIKLIDRVSRTMGRIFSNIILSSNTPDEYSYLNLPIYEDLIKGLGPLGGIYTILKSITENAAFFVACDMPFLNENLIRHMVEVSVDYDVVVPRMDWKIEALHSLHTKNCTPVIENMIALNDYKTMNIFKKANTRYIDEEELKIFDPDLRSFINVNRPEELIEAENNIAEN